MAKALVKVEDDAILPSADQLEYNVRRYQSMQKILDKLMPDMIIEAGTNPDGSAKLFRRKGYWKAIAQGFSLSVELVTEQREEREHDFGYCVTYKATDPRTGRSADGDGACFATEKAQRRGGIGGTEHNVRAHAHTRATNRAISNLVAFGEVSAEELETTASSPPRSPLGSPVLDEEPPLPEEPPDDSLMGEEAPVSRPMQPRKGNGADRKGNGATQLISEKQARRLYAITMQAGRDPKDISDYIDATYGYTHSSQIERSNYDAICDFAAGTEDS